MGVSQSGRLVLWRRATSLAINLHIDPMADLSFRLTMNGSSIMVFRAGGLAVLAGQTVRQGFRRPFERSLWLEQLEHVGVHSLTITNVTLLFTGMVLAVQTAYSLKSYGGQSFVGNLLGLSIVRELGPVLTALIVAGRGAGITAEIGSITVTEQ
jgi:phospholipid/cholesterol/gamma-HCH transport system permease protein